MNATVAPAFRILRFILLLATLAIVSGCATQRIDWSTRVGNYTFDQAIIDYGPPDKQAKLEDGTIVAEWLTHRGRSYVSYGYAGWGYPYWWGGPFYPHHMHSTPDYYLRLIFSPDGKLTSWKNFAK